MKAVLWKEIGKCEVVDMPEPQIKRPNDVKIRVEYCGICENDIWIMSGKFPPLQPPMLMGHEFCGTVVEVGPDVRGVKVGDRVACDMQEYCGHCFFCQNGYENYCENIDVVPGAYAEYTVVKEDGCFHIPDEMDWETAAFLEPLSAALYCLTRAEVDSGKTLAMFGGGSKAQMQVMLAYLKGATKITVIDPSPRRREMALKNGADFVIDPSSEDVIKRSMEITGGLGFDSVIEESGIASNCALCIDIVRARGVVDWASSYLVDEMVPIPVYKVRSEKCLTIKGSIQSPYMFQRGMNVLSRVPVKNILEGIYPLDRFQEALELQDKGDGFKILVKP